ncbi:hypothetical protein Dthio_PD2835 [Desulfonatronospira thiodismutans ASO3-1]|uniref:Uncharacterized protein n=1 Tax=Desulfonatronospira thiodismutans ASO3-1 TaxID=555779 RepID=D6SL56_9BACT|nr:hypothetical protein Dthio_PD2835 [Desulfonatronospira thiodismutans ASO3-1]
MPQPDFWAGLPNVLIKAKDFTVDRAASFYMEVSIGIIFTLRA